MQVFTISDTHFGHANIIKYCDRPFENTHHMNKMMTQWWNEVVSDDDLVIFVGDFAYWRGSDKVENVRKYLQFLNGKKVCVRGNHDPSTEKLLEAGFHSVCDSMVYSHEGARYLFAHHPLGPDKARLNILGELGARALIHGHQHNETPLVSGRKALNVSCENTNYRPMLLSEVVKCL